MAQKIFKVRINFVRHDSGRNKTAARIERGRKNTRKQAKLLSEEERGRESMKIAVIGKIGSGKTVFLRAAAERKDVVCVYADELNRSLFSDAGYLARLKELFPEAFLGGVFDKKALANVVFADKKKRLLLNALAHPEITRLAGGIIKDAEKEGKHIVFEVPLLAESGMAGMFDEVVCIKAPEAVRLERIKARDGMTAEEAAARDKSASKESEKLASVVIENDGAKEEFLRKVNLFLDSVFD